MNMLSQNVIAFPLRRPHIAASPRTVARDITIKSANLICRWDRSPITGRLTCVWTSPDAASEVEAQIYLCLAS